MEPGWLSVLPPLLALVLAVVLREVYVSLLIGIFCGAVILAEGDVGDAFLKTLDTYIVDQISDPDHVKAMLFTLCLGAMIGVMSASGGTRAMVDRLAVFTSSRRRGMLLTWAMGLVVFFDDYANTLLVGGSMRPVTDRLRISREKLAFLIDSTAAPIAGLAVVSTWVGFEVGQIQAGFDAVGVDVDAASVFVRTIPYRFYPLFLIAFVFLIAAFNRDFGPMLNAERRALSAPPDAAKVDEPENSSDSVSDRRLVIWFCALAPIGTLLTTVVVGFINETDSYRFLLVASFLGSATAFIGARVVGALDLRACSQAWVDGAITMFPAIMILVLAWSIAGICDAEHLGTAQFIVGRIGDQLQPEWLPTIAFLTAGIAALATGSSFATMGLLMPLFISLVWTVLGNDPAAGGPAADHPIMLASIGAILAGAIFGDHCSPISDTTVLSSAAAECDHLRHVATQLPYALVVALIAIVTGCLPAGWGAAGWMCCLAGVIVTVIVVRFAGRPASDVVEHD